MEPEFAEAVRFPSAVPLSHQKSHIKISVGNLRLVNSLINYLKKQNSVA
jgi:hypothetical protein